MAAMDYKPIYVASGSAFVWPSLVNDLGVEASNGICSATAWCWDATFVAANEEFAKIQADYEELNGEFMAEQVGPAFICTMMVVEAIENGQSTDRDAICDEIRKLTGENSKWFAMINPNSAFNEVGKNVGARPIIGQWQDGRLRAVYPEDIASGPLLNPLTLEGF
jgi:branched-chain amino acid transport system substrate-binding protein